MDRIRVLFVCVHNSARSQMAEAFLNALAGERFEAHSAGLEPGKLNPLAVDVMREVGIDISHKTTQSVFDLYMQSELFSYVITVCDAKAAERCPIFPGVVVRIAWSFEDPASLKGSYEERLARTRVIRDAIESRIKEFIGSGPGDGYRDC